MGLLTGNICTTILHGTITLIILLPPVQPEMEYIFTIMMGNQSQLEVWMHTSVGVMAPHLNPIRIIMVLKIIIRGGRGAIP